MAISPQERQEISELFAKFKQSQDESVMQEIAQKTQGLVVYVLNLYFSHFICPSDREDYFQEGSLALVEAIKLWDSGKGSFEGYAIATIRGALLRFSIKLKMGGLSISQGEKEKFVSLRKRYLPLRAARLPDWHICENLGINQQELVKLEAFLAATSRVYFDAYKDPEKIAQDRNQFEEEMLQIFEGSIQEDHDRIAEIEEAILELPISERDRQIFCHRFGLLGHKKQLLKEIAQDFGASVFTIPKIVEFACLRLTKIQEIRQAKEWLKGRQKILLPAMRRVFVLRYGLDGGVPLGHEAIGRQLGIKTRTSIHNIKEGWKVLNQDPLAQEMRKRLWWKDI